MQVRETADRVEARLAPYRSSGSRATAVMTSVESRRGSCRSSGRWCATASTISCAPRICTGRCASCSISRPWTWFQRSAGVTRGERLRLALEELGPIFVKFGQAVSTRRDLLPADIADELAKLQDRVPPFDGERRRRSHRTGASGGRSPKCSRSFEETPLAAASIAQVHAARAARAARKSW